MKILCLPLSDPDLNEPVGRLACLITRASSQKRSPLSAESNASPLAAIVAREI
jgi:hypothetical protein